MDAHETLEHRRAKDRFFAEDPRSPIPADRRSDFDGLRYYDHDPAAVVSGQAYQPEDPTPFTVQTSTGDVQSYRRAAVVPFSLHGQQASITLLLRTDVHGRQDPHGGFFVPFRDATSGQETYGAGRYIDLGPEALAEDGTVTIDFNAAYNPYCAYDDRFSCPLPPPDNWLRIPVRAGEKTYR